MKRKMTIYQIDKEIQRLIDCVKANDEYKEISEFQLKAAVERRNKMKKEAKRK